MKRTDRSAGTLPGAPDIERALDVVGALLGEAGLAFELVVVGGAALNILGFVSRPTKDVEPFPPEPATAVAQAATDLGSMPAG